MRKMNFYTAWSSLCFMLILRFTCLVYPQESNINPEVAIKVAPGIYIHHTDGFYITIFSGKEGLLIIDTGFKGALPDSLILSEFKKPVKYIINSHYHFDHVGGNKKFAQDGTIIIGQINTRKEMQKVWQKPAILNFPILQPYEEESLPDICFSDSLEIYFNNEIIKLFHVPDAHTNNDIIVFFQKANAIHTGDLFLTLNGFPPFEGSFEGLINAMDFLIRKCDEKTIVIPGHGSVSNREGIIQYKEVLITASNRINKLKGEEKSYEDIVKENPLRGLLSGEKLLNDDMFIYSVYYGKW
jgi:cyclase